MKKILLIFPLFAMMLSACLEDNPTNTFDSAQWRKDNDAFVAQMEALTENGQKVYTRVSADWAPNNYVLMKWHNDRSLTEKNLRPMSTSTVDIVYRLTNYKGEPIDSSYNVKTYGDSIYRSVPSSNVTGMWLAMTNMHVGDSVTLIVPSVSGYGLNGSGSVPGYSALVFNMKMKKVVKYDSK